MAKVSRNLSRPIGPQTIVFAQRAKIGLLFAFLVTLTHTLHAQGRNPGNVDDLTLWLMADHIESADYPNIVIDANGRVERWRDVRYHNTTNPVQHELFNLNALSRPILRNQAADRFAFNYHNWVDFTNQETFLYNYSLTQVLTNSPAVTIFMVTTGDAGIALAHNNTTGSYLIRPNYVVYHNISSNRRSVDVSDGTVLHNHYTTDKARIIGSVSNSNTSITGYRNYFSSTSTLNSGINYTAGAGLVLGTYLNNSNLQFQGGIAEVLIYNKELNSQEILKVRSYLAIKYGIHLEGLNYVNSNQTILYMPGQHPGFNKNITVVGRDNYINSTNDPQTRNDQLFQKQSRSVNNNSLLHLFMGGTANNNAHYNYANLIFNVENNTFFFIADNNASISPDDAVCDNNRAARLPRVWKMMRGGHPNPLTQFARVSVAYSENDLPNYYNRIIVANDGNMSTNIDRDTLTYSAPLGGQNLRYYHFNNENSSRIQVPHNRYLTFGTGPIYGIAVPATDTISLCNSKTLTLGNLLLPADPDYAFSESLPIEWYQQPTGGAAFHTGNAYTFTPNTAGTHTFWVQRQGSPCGRYQVDVVVQNAAPLPPFELRKMCVGQDGTFPAVLDTNGNPLTGTWTLNGNPVTTINTATALHTGTASNPQPVNFIFTSSDGCLQKTLPVVVAPLPDPNNDGLSQTVLREVYYICGNSAWSLPHEEIRELLKYYDVILTGPAPNYTTIPFIEEITNPQQQNQYMLQLGQFAEEGVWQVEVFYEDNCVQGAPVAPCNVAPYPQYPCSQIFEVYLDVTYAGDNPDGFMLCRDEVLTTDEVFEALGDNIEVGGTWSLIAYDPATSTAISTTPLSPGPIAFPDNHADYEVVYTLPIPAGASFDESNCWARASSTLVTFVDPADAGENGSLEICNINELSTTLLFNSLEGTPQSNGTWSPLVNTVSAEDFDANGQLVFTYTQTKTKEGKTCTESAEVLVTLGGLTLLETITDSECLQSNGAIVVSVSGGTAPYTFAWTMAGDPGFAATTQNINNLAPGTYQLIVTDVNDCTATRTYTVESDTINVQFTPPTQNAFCLGQVAVALPNGFNPNITGNWYLESVDPQNLVTEILLNASGQFSYIFVPDDTCVNPQQFVFDITVYAVPTGVQITGEEELCENESLTLTANVSGETTGIGYQWFLNGTAISGADSSTYTVNSVSLDNAGNYTVQVIDRCGNQGVVSAPFEVTITEIPQTGTIEFTP